MGTLSLTSCCWTTVFPSSSNYYLSLIPAGIGLYDVCFTAWIFYLRKTSVVPAYLFVCILNLNLPYVSSALLKYLVMSSELPYIPSLLEIVGVGFSIPYREMPAMKCSLLIRSVLVSLHVRQKMKARSYDIGPAKLINGSKNPSSSYPPISVDATNLSKSS